MQVGKPDKEPDALEAYLQDLVERRTQLDHAVCDAFQNLGSIQGRRAECEKMIGELQRVRQNVELEKAMLVSTPAEPPPPEADPPEGNDE